MLAYIAARRKQGTAVRALADEIGISKSALHALSENRSEYKVWSRITKWYLEDRVKRQGELPDDVTDFGMVALQVLNNIPEAERERALREYAEFLKDLHDRALAPYPDWLARLLARLAGAEEPGGPAEGAP